MKVIIFSENRRDKKSFLCFHGFILYIQYFVFSETDCIDELPYRFTCFI